MTKKLTGKYEKHNKKDRIFFDLISKRKYICKSKDKKKEKSDKLIQKDNKVKRLCKQHQLQTEIRHWHSDLVLDMETSVENHSRIKDCSLSAEQIIQDNNIKTMLL